MLCYNLDPFPANELVELIWS